MFNKIVFFIFLLFGVVSYTLAIMFAYGFQTTFYFPESTYGLLGSIYQALSAFFMLLGMYYGAFRKKIRPKFIYFIVINTIIAMVLSICDDLKQDIAYMTTRELLEYLVFIVVYFGLAIKVILAAKQESATAKNTN